MLRPNDAPLPVLADVNLGDVLCLRTGSSTKACAAEVLSGPSPSHRGLCGFCPHGVPRLSPSSEPRAKGQTVSELEGVHLVGDPGGVGRCGQSWD